MAKIFLAITFCLRFSVNFAPTQREGGHAFS